MTQTIRKPNFFIVGAQRCGTTSLSQYLAAHERIFLTSPKEPFYFATDFPKLRRMETDEDYLGIYRNADPKSLAIGEATAGYLYSATAIPNIHHFNPKAKIIVMLRNPADLVYSFHSHLIFGYFEDEKDFRKAWDLQSERKKGKSIPRGCLVPEFLQYSEMGRLGEQVGRLLQVFPRDQILLTFFEDFIADTGAFYRRTLEFLEVPDDGRTEFPRLNENKRPRFPGVSALFNPRPMWLQKAIDRMKSQLNLRGQKLLQRLYAKPAERQQLSSEAREQLIAFFAEDIELLSQHTGRNLAHWTAPMKFSG